MSFAASRIQLGYFKSRPYSKYERLRRLIFFSICIASIETRWIFNLWHAHATNWHIDCIDSTQRTSGLQVILDVPLFSRISRCEQNYSENTVTTRLDALNKNSFLFSQTSEHLLRLPIGSLPTLDSHKGKITINVAFLQRTFRRHHSCTFFMRYIGS